MHPREAGTGENTHPHRDPAQCGDLETPAGDHPTVSIHATPSQYFAPAAEYH